MTDQATDPQPQTPPSQQQIAPMTPEQVESIKQALIDQLRKAYHAFLNAISRIPMAANCNTEAMRFYDTGLLWSERAIKNLPLQPVVTLAPSVPKDEPKDEDQNQQHLPLDPAANEGA